MPHSLNILTSPPANDLIRFFHQTERDWTRHLAEETQLDVGTAFHNTELSRSWHANGLFDAALPDGTSAADAIAEVESHFNALGLHCWHWIMNPSAPADRTEPLVQHLLSLGAKEHRFDVMHLDGAAAARVGPIAERAGVKIIPARASFRHVRELAAESSNGQNEPQLIEAAVLHAEDPHFDSILALKDGRAIATAGVLAMGEVGRIDGVYVAPAFRRMGFGRVMIGRMMEICLRALFKHVLLSVRPDNEPAKAMYQSFGFQRIGEQTVYILPKPEAGRE